MKLNDVRPNVETSGDLEEKLFGIEDQGMIFDILRNKMYSNPILAICREITCNARDAHREVGKPEAPILIHLPNELEPYYKVTDFGPGISPDRMANIFIKYTASTKRNDNTQTGGFGLGAKTPFSYSDSFSIITNYNGVQYNYNAFIDPSKIGKLALGSESPTSEPNGTTIIIPVQSKNFHEFVSYTEQACRHWTVKPTIKGNTIGWDEEVSIIDGKNWRVCKSNDYNRSAVFIIDGIEYPCPLETLRKYMDTKLIYSARGNLLLYFGIGELTLSASRENIYWDERTQGAICQRMKDLQEELKQRVIDKIDTLANLWLANVYYRDELRQGFHDIRFLGPLKWKGMALNESYVDTGCTTFQFKKGAWTRRRGNDPNKIKRITGRSLSFEQHSALFINDLPLREPTPRHVRKAFDDDPTLVSVQVVCPNDKYPLSDLNTKIHLDKMAPRLLSTITKASGRTYTPNTQRVLVFKFDERSCGFRQSSYSAMEEDGKEKVLCLLSKDAANAGRQIVLKNKDFSVSALRWLSQKNATISFYGVDATTPSDRLEDDFSDLQQLDEFLEELIEDNKTDFVEVKYAYSQASSSFDHDLLKHAKKLEATIDKQDSLFLRRLRLHAKLIGLNRGDSYLLSIYETVNGEITKSNLKKWLKDHPDYNLKKMDEEYDKLYPLMNHLYYYNSDDTMVPAISHYINMADKI